MFNLKIAFFSFFLLCSAHLVSQDFTRVVGKVYDANTKEALPFVDVYFTGTYTGISTDLDGKYILESKFASDSITATFIGYLPQTIAIQQNVRKQVIDIFLAEESVIGDEVVIVAKKKRYRKKDNPAVALMRKVIEKRDDNKMESQDYYSYNKHEKLELDINNITEEFKQRKVLKNFEFLWEYLDTSKVNGKIFLPVYLREVLSKVYYRKDPNSKKEHRSAIRMTEFDEALDMESISSVIDLLYQDVDIYQNSIKLLDNDFLSPLAPWALNYYRFYITDTTTVHDQSAIHLSFIPRNKTFIGFTGDLYISNDNNYRVLKGEFKTTKQISINFVNDIEVVQEFKEVDGVYVKSVDAITLDVSISKGSLGMFATRIVNSDQFSFDPPDDPKVFDGVENIITSEEAEARDDSYWHQNRIVELTQKEQGLEQMIDTLRTVPTYKRFVLGTKILSTGFIPAGPIEIGQISSFVSRNEVEGWRFRGGFETSFFNFSKKFQLSSYLAYGTLDKEFKYRANFLYTFNKDYRSNPRHYVTGSYRHDVVFPGLKLLNIEDDNFLTSFRRGTATKMLFIDSYNFDYYRETNTGWTNFSFEHRNRKPYGSLDFQAIRDGETVKIDDVKTTEFGLSVEYSPNTSYIQGRKRRTPIVSAFPTFQMNYAAGIKGLVGGQFNYHRLSLMMSKRIPMSIVGRSELEVELGRIFGKELPYVILYVPRANQAYSFQPYSFNVMNFLEFSTDKYARINLQHFFDGFIFNRIPLWRALKLKEVVTFKMVYGGLDDVNDPNINRSVIQFPLDENGNPTTFAFTPKVPYIEYGFGIYNIFKIFRFDLIQRANYLDHPNVPSLFGVKGLALRGRFKVEF